MFAAVIGKRSTGTSAKKGIDNGKKTLRLNKKGEATVEDVSGSYSFQLSNNTCN